MLQYMQLGMYCHHLSFLTAYLLNQSLLPGEVPGTVYGVSKKGWIGGNLFNTWLSCHFLTHAPPVHPLLLLMEDHSLHC